MGIKLHELLINKDSSSVKAYLQELPSHEKGDAFEKLLAELYRGNGWLVSVQGGRGDEGADILLYHPKSPQTVSFIVQAKNHAKPLTLDQTRIELIKFEQQAAPRYKCQQFRIVAINGFVQEADKLGQFNILLDSWSYVESLHKRYDPGMNAEPKIELYAHNRATYENIQDLWQDNDHVAVIQATGTGKSFLIAQPLADFQGKRKIVLAPSHFILDQQKSKAPWANEKTTYWTYAGLAQKSETAVKALKCALIVLDEFHRCGADVWGKSVQMLLDTHPDAKVLGTTATPIRYLDENRNMAEELFDGVVATELSLAEAIVKRILPAPTYISALYTMEEEVRNLLTDIEASKRPEEEKVALRAEIQALKVDWEKTSGIPEILKKHLPSGINKLIVFCRDQQHLDEMEIEVQKWFQKAGVHHFREKYRVISADPASKKNLQCFKDADDKDTVHLLFAIDMLNEGLHIPEVGAVILLRPTVSPIIFYQQIGRCIEVGKDHTPIIFDLVNNFQNLRVTDFLVDLQIAKEEEKRKRSAFDLEDYAPGIHIEELTRPIEAIFESIYERLSPWETQFAALLTFKEKHGHCNVPQSYADNPALGTWVNNQRALKKKNRLPNDRIHRLETIGFVWGPLADTWEQMFVMLLAFKEKHGHCNVPQSYTDNPALGPWVNTQRAYKKNNRLPEDRLQRLEKTGFIWDLLDDAWEQMFSELHKFKEKHGHCNVPQTYDDNPALGTWSNNQRTLKKKNRLPEGRVHRLEEIGFIWGPRDDVWEQMFAALRAFKQKLGHCNVPTVYNDNPVLGRWVDMQRQMKKKNRLPEERVQLLEKIGFIWDPYDDAWEQMFAALRTFKEEHGHCKVSKSYAENPALGTWVGTQRVRKKRLPEDRVQRLEEIGFIWNPYDDAWEQMFVALRTFKQKQGHCNVPAVYDDNPVLGRWVNTQRSMKKKNQLSEDYMRRLEDIGFIWDLLDDAWEQMFAALSTFKKNNRHCNVPALYTDNPVLGSWVNRQRSMKKKNRLPEDRVQRLEEIGFAWTLREISKKT